MENNMPIQDKDLAREERIRKQMELREKALRDKALNNSMVALSKKNREYLGIISVQPKKNVFFLESRNFVKVYSIKGVELTESRKNILVTSLMQLSSNRMRLTTVYYRNSFLPMTFLTVYFSGETYASLADDIDEFDSVISSFLSDKFKISFEQCDIGDVFMFVSMNYSGVMKKVNKDSVIRRSNNLKKNYFNNIHEIDIGYLMPKTGRFGCCYICTQFPDDIDDIFSHIKGFGCGYISCIDFQITDSNYSTYFKRTIEESYSSPVGSDKNNFINLTFLLNLMFESEEEEKTIDKQVRELFFENNLVCSPAVGAHAKVLDCLSSFGLCDYHCNRNVNVNLVSKLFG